MTIPQKPPYRIPLAEFLKTLPEPDAKAVLLLLARGALRFISEDRCAISRAEEIVFNLHALLYCKDFLKDAEIESIVSYGMELVDVDELVPDREELGRACREIESRITRLGL